MKKKTKTLSRAGVFAGLYVALSLLIMPLSFGFVQVRLAEGLCLLPLIFPEAVPALFIGCIISNLVGGCMLLDVIFGSLITLVAALLSWFVGRLFKRTALKIIIGGLFPVLLNALLLPVVWYFCYGGLKYIYIVQAAIILAGQAFSVYAVGTPILLACKKLKESGLLGMSN